MKHLAIVAALLLAACTTHPAPAPTATPGSGTSPPGAQAASDDRLDIAEAVFRSLYGENASAEMTNKAGASLCFGKDDPPAAFLRRFADLRPPAMPCSASTFDEARGELVLRGSGKPAISFSVGDIRIQPDGRAVVDAGYYEAGLSSGGYTFRLRKVSGRWTVESREMNWIS